MSRNKNQMSVWTALLFTVFLTKINGCKNPIRLHSMIGRSRVDLVDTNAPQLIHDNYLLPVPNWYNVSVNGSQYHMPGSDHMPDLNACGTREPIYLKANQTNFDNLTEGEENSMKVCKRTAASNCAEEREIKIRKCDTGIQYYLEATSLIAAYCFDPPNLQGKAILAAPMDANVGLITVKPTLDFLENATPYSVFICNFTKEPHLYYTITWTIKQNKTVIIRRGALAGNATFRLTESDLQNNNIIMGFNIQCGVQVSADPNGTKTPKNNSDEYFAGIRVLTPTLTIPKGGSGTVVYQFTVPVGCSIQAATQCTLSVHMQIPIDCKSGIAFQKCSLDNITTYNDKFVNSWDPTKNYSMAIYNIEKYVSDPTTFTLLLEVQNRTDHELWNRYQLTPINVFIKSNIPPGKCHSRVDPHMMTADGRQFENQNKQMCLLYKHRTKNIKVEEKYGFCNNYKARCTCGVRIQAGKNVFAIDGCSQKTWLIDYVQCEGTNTLRVYEKTSKVWEIITPIGTTIKVIIDPFSKTYRWFMNVEIFMSPRDFENIHGLCGNYDGISSNDFSTAENLKQEFCDYEKTLFQTSIVEALADWNVEETSYCDCSQGRNMSDDGGPYSPNCSLFTDMGCSKYSERKHNKCVIIRQRDVHSSKRIREINRISKFTPNIQQEPTIIKRSSLDVTISEDDARLYCTSVIENTTAATLGFFGFANENMTAVISDCTFDVHMGNDYTLSRPHIESVNIVVRHMLEKDPVYVQNNNANVTEFLKASCINNCSNNGICNEQGVCECYENFHDGDCSINERTRLVITDAEGDGFCALEDDEDCTCFYLYTSNVLPSYKCQITGNMTFVDGTIKAMERQVVPGVYEDAFTAYCCIPEERSERSANNDNVFIRTLSLSLSNNGESYSLEQRIVVYTPRCQDRELNSPQIKFHLKPHFCYINSECFAENTSMINDGCQKCKPQIIQYDWTNNCDDAETEGEAPKKVATIVVTVLVTTLLVISCIVAFTCLAIKKYKARKLPRVGDMQHENSFCHLSDQIPPETNRPDNSL